LWSAAGGEVELYQKMEVGSLKEALRRPPACSGVQQVVGVGGKDGWGRYVEWSHPRRRCDAVCLPGAGGMVGWRGGVQVSAEV
jgi:hypothetical protein